MKQGSEVLVIRNTLKKEMDTLKAQFEERAKLDLAEKESLNQRLKKLEGDLHRVEELKKQISLSDNMRMEKDKCCSLSEKEI